MQNTYTAVDGGTDGRDTRTLATFAHEEDAVKAARGHGTSGYGDGSVYATRVFDSFDEYMATLPAGNRDRETWMREKAKDDAELAHYLALRDKFEPDRAEQ